MEDTLRIIEDISPDIIGLVETHMKREENVEINGYKIIRKDRQREGGGLLIGIKNKFAHLYTELEMTEVNNLESLWITLGSETKYKIGLIYAPKGDKLKLVEIKELYQGIEEQIEGQENHRLIIMGDFNAKSGDQGKAGSTEKDKGGRELIKLTQRQQLKICNTMEQTEGVWTRKEGNSKSTLDYIILKEKESSALMKMMIDEDKNWTPHHVVKEDKREKEIYSDHCAIISHLDWAVDEKKARENKRSMMTRKSYLNYAREIKKQKVSNILKAKGTMQENYDKWVGKVMDIKKKTEVMIKKKKHDQTVRKLMRVKRNIKKSNITTNRRNQWLKLINKHIVNENQNRKAKKIRKNIEALRRNGGGVKEETFWEFKRRISGKKEEQRVAMRDENGKIETEPEKIKKIYAEFYENLFINELNQETKDRMKVTMEDINMRGSNQKPIQVEEEEIKKVIKTLKRRKAGDQEGWVNEMIIEGDEEMVKSLTIICNRIMKELNLPHQWQNMKIISLYKNKGARAEMKNRRGIFLTSILSKILEKVIMEKSTSDLKESCYQNGGRKNRSGKDNWLAMLSVIEKNKYLGRETLILFADAVKCFDKLWLDDCINDIVSTGMREREALLIQRMNEKATMEIITPYGSAGIVEKKSIVKQGTIFGPKLCCSSTSKINEIGAKSMTVVSPNLDIEALIYVDDIEAIGSKRVIEVAGENLKKMEEAKGFTFGIGNGKTQYMVINNRGKKKTTEVEIKLKNGIVTKTKEYKYLGNWLDERGTMERQLQEMETKVKGMTLEAKRIGAEDQIGKFSMEARLLIYERTIVPTITYNLECWTRMREKDIKDLERIQSKVLKMLLNLPDSTPYWGILNETGIWPLQMVVNYHRLMLYQSMIDSEDSRLGRKVIKEQKENEWGWFKETKKIVQNLEIDKEWLENDKKIRDQKSTWKKEVKKKINLKIESLARTKREESRKMRHQVNQKFERKKYLQEMGVQEATKTVRRRLEMYDIGNNMGKNRKCTCGEKETTEHVLKCQKVKMGETIEESWLAEVNDIWKIRKVNQWIESFVEKRKEE